MTYKSRELCAKVAEYLFQSQKESFVSVGKGFELSYSTVSRIALQAGFAPRKPGRNPKEKPTS